MPKLPAAERRAQIIDAAVVVALREGIDRMTTRRVAQQAGVAVSVLHYCFGTRDALLREVITNLVEDTSQSMASVFEGGGDLRSCLNRAIELFCASVEANPDRHLLTYEMTTWAVRNPEFADLGAWQYDCYYRATEAFFDHLADVTGVTWSIPVSTLARLMVGLNEGVTLAWLIDRDGTRARMTYAAFTDQVVDLATPVRPAVR
ncbi:MAG: TetR family transcriptional regulator [Frankiales bacterium]|jgi:AcrR family transcriptional regulator|nr:TetR family transcriptional regulator [Frankiales bacterium]